MDQVTENRRPKWPFSLRELLLLMVAAAALIGWGTVVYRSQRLKPSSFFQENENWQADVVAVMQEIDEPPVSAAAGTMMHTEGTAAVLRTFVFRLPLPTGKIGAFLKGFEKRVRDKLVVAGCKPSGEAAGSGANQVKVIGYTKGPISGTVQICVGEAGEDQMGVVLTMQEQSGSSTSFGLTQRGL